MSQSRCEECIGCMEYYCTWCEEITNCEACGEPYCETCAEDFKPPEGEQTPVCQKCIETKDEEE